MLHEILSFGLNTGLNHFNIYRFYVVKICPQLYESATVTEQVQKIEEHEKL
jgi:hypothetical protein